MNTTQNLITQAGLKKLKEELKELISTVRIRIAEDIQKAKEFGDLSENAAYTSAMDARDLNEARIAELEELINNSKVVSSTSQDDGTVNVGSKVIIKTDKDEEMAFTIVGVGEGDPLNGQISSDTPLAHAILGKKIKSKVTVELPSGRVTYEILKIK